MSINTYPEMNETIKNLLRMSQDDPMKAYTLARIEELEVKVAHYEKALERIAEDRSVAFWELSSKVAKEALEN